MRILNLFMLLILFNVVTTELNGQQLFTKCIQTCSMPGSYKFPIQQMVMNQNSDIWITGSGAQNFQGFFISRNDSLNNLIWCNEYQWSVQDTIFGATDTVYRRNRSTYGVGKYNENSMLLSLQQEVWVYTLVNNTLNIDHAGMTTAVLNRIDSGGNVVWSKLVDPGMNNQIRHIASTSDKILFAGIASNGSFIPSVPWNQFLLCTDSSGVNLWHKLIPNTYNRTINKILNYFNQGFLVLSSDSTGLCLMNLDLNGNEIWSNHYSSSLNLTGTDLHVGQDSSVFILSYYNSGPYQSCVIKLDQSGNVVWSNIYGFSSSQIPFRFLDSSNDSLQFLIRESYGVTGDVVNIKTDINGTVVSSDVVFRNFFISTTNPTSYSSTELRTVEKQGDFYIGNVYERQDLPMVGYYPKWSITTRFDHQMNSCSFNRFASLVSLLPITVNVNAATVLDSLVNVSLVPYQLMLLPATYSIDNSCTGSVGIETNVVADKKVEIYPNPASELLSIDGADIDLIKILDSKGRVVITLKENPHQVDISSLPPGLYLAVIYRNNGMWTGRFVKK